MPRIRRTSGAFRIIMALLAAAGITTGVVTTLENDKPDSRVHFALGVDDGKSTPWGTLYETRETLDIKYRVAPRAREGFGDTGTLSEQREEMKVRLSRPAHRGEGYRLRPKNADSWSKNAFALKAALERYTDRMRVAPEGFVLFIRAEKDRYQEKGTKVDVDPRAIINTVGNDAIDLSVGTVVERFPNVRSLGIVVCKRISGSSSWSQHAYGNGADFGGPGPWGSAENIRLLDKVVNYLEDLDPILPISQIGWRNWANHYPGHVHISGAPLQSGTPACAR